MKPPTFELLQRFLGLLRFLTLRLQASLRKVFGFVGLFEVLLEGLQGLIMSFGYCHCLDLQALESHCEVLHRVR
jgi:hypothetical protein